MVKTTKKRTKNTVSARARSAEKENDEERASVVARSVGQGPMYTILSNAQLNETFHKRYIKEMKKLYSQLDHDAFVFTFIKMLKTVLEAEDHNEYGNTALSFCAKFVTSFESEKTHPMLAATFNWLLSTKSNVPHIRYRICFFVNLILKELGPCAALDDTQCDQILNYMLDRLTDIAASVRKQAVLAMQRLQMPENPDDLVLRAYQYHLSSDPSSSVRQCVITCMGRNYLTVPYILERLWDVDEKVRRHTYLNMCNYPVRSYKVSQRLTLMEQGLNDNSESVRKAVVNYMIKQWIESYQRNFVALTAALKLDSNEEELLRYKRVAGQMLEVIFEQTDNAELLAQLPLSEDCELHRCVPHEELTVELVLYWQCLSGYLQRTHADECDQVLPELSVFCAYVEKFCHFQKPDMDKFAQVEFQCMLLSLVEILHSYDLGDEIGRNNLKLLIKQLLKDCLLDHKIVSVLVRSMEQLITDVNERMQCFLEIIYEICELNSKQNDLVHDRNLMNKLLDDLDTTLKMKVSSLKLKILELEEQEEVFVRQKEYIRAQAVNDEKVSVTEEYTELIRPLLEKHGIVELTVVPKLSKKERIIKSLYMAHYLVASVHVKSLSPSLCKLYKDLICRQMASTETEIFEWAIKCGTTFSMLYESYAKEVFEVLIDQFYKDNNLELWETSATCIFMLMDHYGVENFIDINQIGQPLKTKRRQLYTMQDFFDGEEDKSQQSSEQNTDIIGMMGHFVERVVDKGIGLAMVKGLCRLVLRRQLDDRADVHEKLLKRYFNPNTEPIISQALGEFFQQIMAGRMQHILQPCLLPTVWSIFNCSFDSPLHDVLPENVTKFIIDLTHQEVSTPINNIHNKIALSFLDYIHKYFTERKEMCRLLAKELTNLQLNVRLNAEIKAELQEMADKLIQSELEPRMIRNIVNFKGMLDGNFNPPFIRQDGNESDDECDSVTVTTTSENTQAPVTESEEITPAAIPQDNIERPPEDTNQVATTTSTTESDPPTAEQVLTTFGQDNQVGIRFLRRSLHKSISHSDAESVAGSDRTRKSKTPARKPTQDEENKASEISKRNLRRPQTQRRLEHAMARASKTPEKAPSPRVDNSSSSSSTDTDTDTSEVIAASPTSESPNVVGNASRLRLQRSMRNRNTSQHPMAASKCKVLHLEKHTPLRNGRKRLLRKSPPHSKTQSSDSATSPNRITPRRKLQRIETVVKQHQVPKIQSSIVATNSTIATASPTDSTSSVKENKAPTRATIAAVSSPKPSEPTRRMTSRSMHAPSTTGTPITVVITRNSARNLRINSMCMTRKRMSQELNVSGGQLKVSTPKRVQRSSRAELAASNKRMSTNRRSNSTTKASEANSSSAGENKGASTSSRSTRTRALGAATVAPKTRARRK
ncbi:condensin complex subunit 3 [Scaptodrosophila lebanonensis]|uniref:Condensin complex subunit 3 n=1 Tax=Drosophila lebanonensis TaxID=7225 RepID=A0A6J2TC86_DROLE|nr:condensin complex subunit 3 [Scaptodrosophila lebanonensis]